MKFQVFSDLHLHFADFMPPITEADAIIVAGDIDNGQKGIDWICELALQHEKPIIWVLGNHEHYGESQPELAEKIEKDIEKQGMDSLVTLLHRKRPNILIRDVLILGSTLWTDMCGGDTLSIHMSNYYMNDFHCINQPNPRADMSFCGKTIGWKAEDSIIEHQRTLKAFREARDETWEDKLLVVTHHSPSIKSIPPQFKESDINGAYYSDLEDVMDELRVHTWIHGHVHNNFDYITAENTRVVCNPRGYVGHETNLEFNPAMIIEV